MLGDEELEYSAKVELEHRKKFAQFFTPFPVADMMASWLLGNGNLKTVLEPAFGLGVFSRALLGRKKNLDIKGLDIDDVILSEAREIFKNVKQVHIERLDYIFNDWGGKYDGIICNPPYLKFHDYDSKANIEEIQNHLSCELSGLTNLYALFMLKSLNQLKEGGRCAYIVPSEFLNSDYGTFVKRHLLETGMLRCLVVFDFKENVFDDALTTASIILCANDGNKEKVRFVNVHSAEDLDLARKAIELYPEKPEGVLERSAEELAPDVKWKAYYQEQNGTDFENLVPFSRYAKVVRGIETGSNDYFVFNESKASQYGIKSNYLLPCISRCADVKQRVFLEDDFDKLMGGDKKVFLLNAVGADDSNVKAYIELGVEKGVDKKYITSHRTPWYSLERRLPAPIWVSVFNRGGLRFVRNKTNALNLTTFHCVYPTGRVSTDLLFAYLLTNTAKRIFADNSREYGNGLLKFEPNDLNKGNMLDLGVLNEEESARLTSLADKYAQTGDSSVLDEMDEILLKRYGKRS